MVLTVFDYIRISFMLIAFVSAAFHSLDTLLKADFLLNLVFGLALVLRPRYILMMQTEKGLVDSLHLFLYRTYGGLLLGIAFVWLMNHKSMDKSILGSMLWSRFISLTLQFLVLAYRLSVSGQKLTPFFYYFILGETVLMLLANMIRLVQDYPFVGHNKQDGQLAWLMKLDFLLLFLIGSADIAFPKVFLQFKNISPDPGHQHICQLCGSIILGLSLLSLHGLGRYLVKDQKIILSSRVVVFTVTVAVAVYGHLFEKFLRREELWMLCFTAVPVFVACIGLLLIHFGKGNLKMKSK